MRIVLSAVAALGAIVSTPALADESEPERIADALGDPGKQAEMAAMVETMTALVLDMPVAPLLRAQATMEGGDPDAIDPDLTVRDLAGPDALQAPREIAVRLPQMMGALAALAVSFEQMLPQLRAMGDTLAHPAPSGSSQ